MSTLARFSSAAVQGVRSRLQAIPQPGSMSPGPSDLGLPSSHTHCAPFTRKTNKTRQFVTYGHECPILRGPETCGHANMSSFMLHDDAGRMTH